jgi:hypothetical protein
MAVKQKIFIPTFISSVDYQPVRTLPHIYFYNGLKDCEPYYIQHYATGSGSGVVSTQIEQFPYFDNYDGLIPTTGSNSLLFFNETSVYGDTPTASLYTEYWDKYVTLLYNPVTRLLNASAIIPLADYFDMELNDIVQWRGNYYHLRAINDYNLKDGTCNIQLLGPIIPDATSPITFDCNFNFSSSIETAIPTTTIPSSTTTTGPIGYQYFINYAQDGGASNNSTACGPTTLYSVWSLKSNINSITNGDVLYSNAGLSTIWNGNLEWYGINTAYGLSPSITLQITNAGVVATTGVCSVPTTSTTTAVPTTTIEPTTTIAPTTLAPTTSTTTAAPTTLAPTTSTTTGAPVTRHFIISGNNIPAGVVSASFDLGNGTGQYPTMIETNNAAGLPTSFTYGVNQTISSGLYRALSYFSGSAFVVGNIDLAFDGVVTASVNYYGNNTEDSSYLPQPNPGPPIVDYYFSSNDFITASLTFNF